MDCGPAALKSALDGFGIAVSYRRLREACQTDVDGTSIDTLEDIAQRLGLDAEQVLIPADHVFLPETHALPAIAVTVGRDGTTHFVVLWSALAGRVQIMDPAAGRRWLTRAELERRLLLVSRSVPASAFREHAASAEFAGALERRLRALVSRRDSAELLALALKDASFRTIAALDAATRAVAALARSGALPARRERAALVRRWLELGADAAASALAVPENYWYARGGQGDADAERGGVVSLAGVVLLGLTTRRAAPAPVGGERGAGGADPASPAPAARPALKLQDSADSPLRELLRLLQAEGTLAPALLLLGAVLVGSAGILEALILSALLELQQFLGQPVERFAAALAVLCFMALSTLGDVPLTHRVLRLGSRLETRLRIAFLQKLPSLPDRYFQSRPVSDMAERAHMVHVVRVLPLFLLSLLRLLCSWLVTALGMIWLDPQSATRIALAALACVAVPLCVQRALIERDGRVRALSAALSRCYLDALRGLGAIRAHAAQRNVHLEHERQLSAWNAASLGWGRAVTALELAVSASSTALSAWLFLAYVQHHAESAAALLYLYWALTFPGFGRELANLVRQLPSFINIVSRLIEPLGALSPDPSPEQPSNDASSERGVAIELRDVTLALADNAVLTGIDLRIEAGEQLAIVGASGAGKSSLLGLLLGFHRPRQGQLLLDGVAVGERELEALRQSVVWVEPGVELWNRSLLANLEYGAEDANCELSLNLHKAALHELVAKLPRGLQTRLGESGGTLSGGEGQRVRFARALARRRPRLALLDEPFRGLDREQRSTLLTAARETWRAATLLCVTHDIEETLAFPRVVVMAAGKIVQDGAPQALLAEPSSHYAALLRGERALGASLSSPRAWRRLRIENGRLLETGREASPLREPSATRSHTGQACELGAAE